MSKFQKLEDMLTAGFMGGLNSATLGTLPRLIAAGQTAFGDGTYDNNLEDARRDLDALAEEHPVANIVGSAVPSLAMGPAGIAKSAALGAASGLGGTRGDLTTLEGAKEAALDAAQGGALGGALGGVGKLFGKGREAVDDMQRAASKARAPTKALELMKKYDEEGLLQKNVASHAGKVNKPSQEASTNAARINTHRVAPPVEDAATAARRATRDTRWAKLNEMFEGVPDSPDDWLLAQEGTKDAATDLLSRLLAGEGRRRMGQP